MTSQRTLAAHSGLRTGLAVRASLAAVGGAILLASGILLARAGITDQHFPAYVAGMQETVIPTYSGPLIGAAIGLGLLAGLLWVSAITDWWRRRLITAARPKLEQ